MFVMHARNIALSVRKLTARSHFREIELARFNPFKYINLWDVNPRGSNIICVRGEARAVSATSRGVLTFREFYATLAGTSYGKRIFSK